jgi:hypothetical protein
MVLAARLPCSHLPQGQGDSLQQPVSGSRAGLRTDDPRHVTSAA